MPELYRLGLAESRGYPVQIISKLSDFEVRVALLAVTILQWALFILKSLPI
jgi:hypothetical protein